VKGPRIVAGLIALLIVVGCARGDEERAASTMDPDMFVGTATTVDGAEVDLATFGRRDLVVWFWAPW
jgi:hypothetical protein